MLRLSQHRLCRLSSRFLTPKPAFLHSKSCPARVAVDATGIPLKPTWSVHELLSSYSRPTVSPATLKRLHELSALIPPSEGTPDHAKLTKEMEELVKLVEAVKLVDVSALPDEGDVPDGRIWAEGEGVSMEPLTGDTASFDGRPLVAHASRTLDGLYVVETDKPRN